MFEELSAKQLGDWLMIIGFNIFLVLQKLTLSGDDT